MLERIKKLLSHLCFFNTLLLFMWHWRSKLFKSRVPDLWDLMPDDLKWSWCNNNRNKACNKHNALESSQNHPPPPPVHGKIVLYEISPGAKKVGDHWFKCFKETFKSANYARSIYLAVCVCVSVLCCAKLLQLCPTPFDPLNCSPPGSSDYGFLQARILQWVTMPSSRASSRPRNQTCVSLCLLRWQTDSLPLAPPGKL